MKKSCLFFVILGFLFLLFAGSAHCWQGRMGGMGNPYGLVEDESDFLFHPSKIVNGQGINFYGHYGFNYTGVGKLNYTLEAADLSSFFPYSTSGHEWQHEGLIGAAFPVCLGRMGLFFQYTGKRGKFDGDVNYFTGAFDLNTYDFKNTLDSFVLRLLYGFPAGSNLKVGGELQLSYKKEKIKTFIDSSWDWGDFPWGADSPDLNLFPFIIPYDSKYWEVLFKGSLETMMGPLKGVITPRVRLIFSSDNTYSYERYTPAGGVMDMEGRVKGWGLGIDAWWRYPVCNTLTLPFVASFDYQTKRWNGSGPGEADLSPWRGEYQHKENNMKFEVGGGMDYELAKGTKVAAGLYYNYLYGKTSFLYHESTVPPGGEFYPDHTDYPKSKEHRIVLRAAGEKELTPTFALHGGLNFFYGYIKNRYEFNYNSSYFTNQSIGGSHWGIGASLGGTVKFQRFSFEPFIVGGYRKIDLDGTGSDSSSNFGNMDLLRKEWSIGGGFSVKYNLNSIIPK